MHKTKTIRSTKHIDNLEHKEPRELHKHPTNYINTLHMYTYKHRKCLKNQNKIIVQALCESRGGRPGLSVLTSLLVSVDVKLY